MDGKGSSELGKASVLMRVMTVSSGINHDDITDESNIVLIEKKDAVFCNCKFWHGYYWKHRKEATRPAGSSGSKGQNME